MLALALWVVPRTSQRRLHSVRLAAVSLALMNGAVLAGVLCLLNGVNNGAGEYREFIWPVMAAFVLGLVLLAYNFYRTVAARAVEEIYISNWYILAACLWTVTLVAVALPPSVHTGPRGPGIPGSYKTMAAGVWGAPAGAGAAHSFLPERLHQPGYSYP